MSAALTACGGGDNNSRLDNINSENPGGSPTNNGGSDDGGGTDDDRDAQPLGSLGNVYLGTFTNGAIANSSQGTSILPGATVDLAIALYDTDSGSIIDSEDDVLFSSSCLDAGQSTLTHTDGTPVENSTISLDGGRAELSYEAGSCIGEDQLTARTTYENSVNDSAYATITIAPPRFGSGENDNFIEGEVTVAVAGRDLLPGETTPLSVSLVDTNGNLATGNANISFSSSCLNDGSATLADSEGTPISAPIETNSGHAEVLYTAVSCLGTDQLTATAEYEGVSSGEATAPLTVTPPNLGQGQGDNVSVGTIYVENSDSALLPGESTEVSVSITDENGNLATGESNITFESQCLTSGLATLSNLEGEAVTGSLESTTGQVELIYTANGCLNQDQLKATASYEGADAGQAEATVTHVPAQFGRGIGDAFFAGEIEVGIGAAQLSAGGKTSLEVTLVDEDGDLIPVETTVIFNSYCLASDAAVLSMGDEGSGNTFSSSDGVLNLTYTAEGCDGTDNITATAIVGGNEIGKARAAVEVEADSPRNIVFVGADPELISIKGAGGKESSSLTFQVLGTTGTPLSNRPVTFSLNNEMGGTYLSHASATSDSRGFVSTTVNAGTVPNTIRVTATTDEVSSQSNALTITTGIPDQNSFSLSIADHYPIAAWNVDGVETNVTARLADAYNNPAPDGTSVYFTTSGGAIEGSCTTDNGSCTVSWRSQSPRPGAGDQPKFEVTESFDAQGNATSFSIEPCPDGMSECRHGRVRVLATALGNESFIDDNGNALYDGAEDIFATGGNCSPVRPVASAEVVASDAAEINGRACDDLGEAYLDKNFNGERDAGEEIVDEDLGSGFSPANGIYDGILCSDAALATGDCTRNTVTIRDHQTIVMTCDEPYKTPTRGRLPGQRDVDLVTGQSDSVTMLLADCNGNGMPEGTEVSLDLSGANNVTATVSPEAPLGASGEPTTISVNIEADDNEPASGTIRVVISSPSAEGIKESFETIRVNP